MNLRRVPDDTDPSTIVGTLPEGAVVETLDRGGEAQRGEDWFHVRVLCSPENSTNGLEGWVHGVGLPSLLPKRVTVRDTEIMIFRQQRKGTLTAGTRVGVVTVLTAARKVRVRVLDGPEEGNTGEVPSADLAP